MNMNNDDFIVKTEWEPDEKKIRHYMRLRLALILSFIGGGILILFIVQYLVSTFMN